MNEKIVSFHETIMQHDHDPDHKIDNNKKYF